jgi:transposase
MTLNLNKKKQQVYKKLAAQDRKQQKAESSLRFLLKSLFFDTVPITYHLENILNFFENRSTNANAESFNSKIKLFRANLRGVTDTCFFLFRLQKLFA